MIAPSLFGRIARANRSAGVMLTVVGLLTASDVLSARANAAERTKEITFDTIKFEMKKGDPFKQELLTPAIKKLEGATVRIRGYILPSFQQNGIKQFVLVRDNMECCFGPGAALFDCVLVEMTGDATADFTVRPVSVEGNFAIKELVGPDGRHLAIYHIDGTQVR